MSNINWGIIGCGDVTEKKSGPAFNKVPDSKLVAVMRRDAVKAKDYAQRHHIAKWYSDADKMMAEADINAVYIATPPSSHLDYAISALSKGFNVYVEKPVTRNSAEAEQMAEAVKQSGQKLTVAHYRRAVPMFLHIKELLDSNIIGDIRTVQIRMWQARKPKLVADVATNWRVQPDVSGGGYFHDLEFYNGFSLNQSETTPADDHVCGQILFKNKVVVNGSWCFNVAESETIDSCEIIGSKGKITFPFFGNFVTLKTDAEEKTVEFVHPEHIQQPMITKIVAYFKGDGPNPCSIEEAVTLMKIMDAFTAK